MFKKLIGSMALLMMSSFAQSSIIMVDMELQLLADVSGSVDHYEYGLQLEGYEKAFRSQSVIDAITSNEGSIAVQYVEWSGSTQQAVQVDWTVIDSAASSVAFADSLSGLIRAFSSGTYIGDAINFGVTEFSENGIDSLRQVMDVSGDGFGYGFSASTARDNALSAGIDAINGITIGGSSYLQTYYKNNVVGGDGSFHIHASTFTDFTTGIELKLVREITDSKSVPAPATIAIFALALLGLTSRRKLS